MALVPTFRPVRRRALRFGSTVLLILGLLGIADAALTLTWREPVSSIYSELRQRQLGGELDRLGNTPLSPAERRGLARLRSDARRAAFLARSLRARAGVGQPVGRIEIPKINARYVVVEGTDPASLRKGPGHYPYTPFPGMAGTVAIAGHRTTYLAPFNKIDQLRKGDLIRLTMPYATVSYKVERTRIVLPTATWITNPVGYKRLVLSACHPKFSAARRIVVFARQTSVVLSRRPSPER